MAKKGLRKIRSRGVGAHGALGPVVRTVSKGHDRTKKHVVNFRLNYVI